MDGEEEELGEGVWDRVGPGSYPGSYPLTRPGWVFSMKKPGFFQEAGFFKFGLVFYFGPC